MKEFTHIKDIVDKLSFPELIIEIERLGLQNIPAYPVKKGEKIYRARPTDNTVRHIISY